ncbi:hypothetical protein Hanom_Chr04g00356951 [Helianthus anomalus]
MRFFSLLNCGMLSGVLRPEFITGVVISISSGVIRSPTVGFGDVSVSKTNRRSIFYFIVLFLFEPMIRGFTPITWI